MLFSGGHKTRPYDFGGFLLISLGDGKDSSWVLSVTASVTRIVTPRVTLDVTLGVTLDVTPCVTLLSHHQTPLTHCNTTKCKDGHFEGVTPCVTLDVTPCVTLDVTEKKEKK